MHIAMLLREEIDGENYCEIWGHLCGDGCPQCGPGAVGATEDGVGMCCLIEGPTFKKSGHTTPPQGRSSLYDDGEPLHVRHSVSQLPD